MVLYNVRGTILSAGDRIRHEQDKIPAATQLMFTVVRGKTSKHTIIVTVKKNKAE